MIIRTKSLRGGRKGFETRKPGNFAINDQGDKKGDRVLQHFLEKGKSEGDPWIKRGILIKANAEKETGSR